MRIGMIGFGKTGQEIGKYIYENKELELVSVMCSKNSEKIGKDIGTFVNCEKFGVVIDSINNLERNIKSTKPDIIIDFSDAKATVKNAEVISRMKVNLVIGTTGFNELEIEKLAKFSRIYNNGIVYAPNITIGVNVAMMLSNIAASILNNYEFHINEIHHKHKKDSPSGTAIKIAKEIEKGLYSAGVKNIEGTTISSVRAGGVIGRHEVLIVGENDMIEISHESITRKAFAEGAIKATKFINGKIGFYEMKDVLNLEKVINNYIEDKYKTAVN